MVKLGPVLLVKHNSAEECRICTLRQKVGEIDPWTFTVATKVIRLELENSHQQFKLAEITNRVCNYQVSTTSDSGSFHRGCTTEAEVMQFVDKSFLEANLLENC